MHQQLREIFTKHGPAIFETPRQCEAILKDLVGERPREIRALATAVEGNVVQELISWSGEVPAGVILTRLATRLESRFGISQELAYWATAAWGFALGRTAEEYVNIPAKATAPPPVVTEVAERLVAKMLADAVDTIHPLLGKTAPMPGDPGQPEILALVDKALNAVPATDEINERVRMSYLRFFTRARLYLSGEVVFAREYEEASPPSQVPGILVGRDEDPETGIGPHVRRVLAWHEKAPDWKAVPNCLAYLDQFDITVRASRTLSGKERQDLLDLGFDLRVKLLKWAEALFAKACEETKKEKAEADDCHEADSRAFQSAISEITPLLKEPSPAAAPLREKLLAQVDHWLGRALTATLDLPSRITALRFFTLARLHFVGLLDIRESYRSLIVEGQEQGPARARPGYELQYIEAQLQKLGEWENHPERFFDNYDELPQALYAIDSVVAVIFQATSLPTGDRAQLLGRVSTIRKQMLGVIQLMADEARKADETRARPDARVADSSVETEQGAGPATPVAAPSPKPGMFSRLFSRNPRK